LPEIRLPALVDTGATESCIDSVLATRLGLPVVDQWAIAGVQGESKVDVHLAQIYVPELDFTVAGRFSGVHLSDGGQPHSALIGRTFLQNFTMVYGGRTGTVTISND
jgi:predicted aspartyl protease